MAAGTTFFAMRERNGKLFFGGLLVSNVGTWAQATATALLVARLAPDHKGQALGFAVMLQFLPMLLFGAWAGAFADQRNRRRLTIVTQIALTAQALLLTVLDFTGHATLGIVYLLSLVLGIANAIDNPARRGIVLELVDAEHLTNAMSLNTAVMTGSRIFGPALAAWLAQAHGTAWCFAVNTVSYLAVIAALIAIDPARLRVTPPAQRGGTPVRDGLRYVWGARRVRIVFLVMAVVSTFAFNYTVSFKLVADNRLGNEAAYGILLAVTGFGSLLGSLFLASRSQATMRIYLGAVVLQSVSSLALAWAPNAAAAYVLAVPMGFGGALFISAANALVQDGAPPTMRSRLLALTAVAFLGSTPIGGPITGWIGDTVSAEWSLAYGALTSLAVVAAATVALTLRPAPRPEDGSVAIDVDAAAVPSTRSV